MLIQSLKISILADPLIVGRCLYQLEHACSSFTLANKSIKKIPGWEHMIIEERKNFAGIDILSSKNLKTNGN